MPEFDIEYSQKIPSVQGAPRVNINTDTGAGMIGQAISNLGNAVFDIGQRHQEANNALQLSGQKRKYDEINAAAYKALDGVTDDETAQKLIGQYQADVQSLRTGNSFVDRNLEMHVNDTITGVTYQFAGKIEKNKVRKLNDEFEVNYQAFLGNGDADGAAELVGNMESSGAITSVKAEYLRKTFMADSYLQQAENQINLGNAKSLENAGGILDALSKTDKIKLTEQQLERMDNLKVSLISSTNRQTTENKELARKQEFEIFEAMEKGTLTWEMISAADKVDPTTLKVYWNQFKNGEAQQLEAGQSAIKEGDPIARTNLLALIDLEPDKVSEADIYKLAGAIGTDHVASMVDRLNRNKKEKNPIASKYKETLSKVMTNGLIGDKTEVQTYEKYVDKVRKLDDFLATNPTDPQAQQFFSGLIREDMKKGTLAKLFGLGIKGLSYSPPGLLFYRLPKYLLGEKKPASVRVQSPDGQIGVVPSEDLQEAINSGYKVVE